ncbi:MAG TPA: 50S ribosomal protein L35ae [Candidatus Nanoarchaeia archaeon]|nr:50S ribosomal protein L35ae [Candidatus Nanoarchaeia archaeon]
MEGTIKNFKRARHHQAKNQMIVYIPGVASKDEAAKLVGKKVSWKSPAGKEIKGEIRSSHGNKGAVRVLFETGMPGQAIAEKVEIK